MSRVKIQTPVLVGAILVAVILLSGFSMLGRRSNSKAVSLAGGNRALVEDSGRASAIDAGVEESTANEPTPPLRQPALRKV